MAEDKVTVSCRPPSFFDPARRPAFLNDSSAQALTSCQPPREVPRAVAAAAAAALARPYGGLRQRASTPRGAVQVAPWPPPLKDGGAAEHFRLGSEPLPLTGDPSGNFGDGLLHFGDSMRILRPSDRAALSTVPPGCAREVETHISEHLRSSGRNDDDGCTPITAVPPREAIGGTARGEPCRRSVWEFHRVNPVDGFAGDIVHYGQLIRIGQRPGAAWPCDLGEKDEILLSCEPPMHGGGGAAPYLVLGRLAGFGHPYQLPDNHKNFDTMFRLLPLGLQSRPTGLPVAAGDSVQLVPASTAAYLNKPRSIRVMPGCTQEGKYVRTMGSISALSELCLEAPLFSFDSPKIARGWTLERLNVAPGSLVACKELRAQVNAGLPRALLGRALATPHACASVGAATAASCQDSALARWERLRSTLLPRLAKRGTFGFADFRKALTVLGQAALLKWEGVQKFSWPGANDPPREEDALLLRADDIASVLLSDAGLQICEEDMNLIARTWGVRGDEQGLVDANYFCDALRGESSPGRRKCMIRLYAQLQRDAGILEHASLDSEWLTSRLWPTLRPWARPGVKQYPFTPDELMGALPLLRSHGALSRAAFVRLTADLTYNVPTHAEFTAFIHGVWGLQIEAMPDEASLWNFGGEIANHGSACLPSISPVSITPVSSRASPALHA